eukprot:CAMPEP_0172456110 /NCGR_PEP_ID=MMETSP1065-20121228/14197_1 /TAXON_ID=265537 /ORGANISM="Amphiprora paludosa, Strain CCMP125" /LENGTH=72 /DNA_ID=CAMNT_0013208787 /DNA_START=83 /DNA_END=296 /DNA_ORIENTATION=-
MELQAPFDLLGGVGQDGFFTRIDPPRAHKAFAFQIDLVATGPDPLAMPRLDEQLGRFFGNMDATRFAAAFVS